MPEPNLKSMPSVLARPRIDSIVSLTELMKQAEACGCVSIPTLNQTGLLKAAFCVHEQVRQLVARSLRGRRRSRSSPAPRPSRAIVSTTREIRPRTLLSRSGEPSCPRKYFEATMLVAVWLQVGRDLDAVLLEDRLALLVVDHGGALLPGHLVVGVSSRLVK